MSGAISKWYEDEGLTAFYSPDLKESEAVKYIRQVCDDAELSRSAWIRDSHLNLAFYKGNFWVTWSNTHGSLQPLEPLDDWEQQAEVPYLPGIVDGIGVKLTGQTPSFVVTPTSSDEEDRDCARASEKLLDHLHEDLGMSTALDELVKWALVTGIGVTRTDFNPVAVSEAEGATAGSPEVIVVNPFNVLFDSGAKRRDLKDCRWVAEQTLVHLDEVHERWPTKARFVKADASPDVYSSSGIYGSTGDWQAKSPGQDRVKVTWYFERPSPKRHPNGYYAAVAGEVLLEEREELPYGLPYDVIRVGSIPGQLYGAGVVSRLRPMQAKINYQESRKLEQIALTAQSKWLVPHGVIEMGAITNEPGQVIRYDAAKGVRPIQVPPVPLSPEFDNSIRSTIADMTAVLGVSSLSNGDIPASISGRAMQWSAELEQTRLSTIVKEMEALLSSVARKLLRIWRDYMPETESIKVMGKSGSREVMAFEASQIRSTDVVVKAGSMAVSHPSVKRETVMGGFERGLYGNPQDPKAIRAARKDMEFGDLDALQGDDPSNERDYARQEATAVVSGQTIRALPIENHGVHIDEHTRFLTSTEARSMPPEVFRTMIQHIADHSGFAAMETSGQPWYTKYLSPDHPLAAAAQPQAPQPQAPSRVRPAPTDVFGPDPVPMPVQPPPKPLSMGLPVGGARGPGIADTDMETDMGSPMMSIDDLYQ